MLNALTNGSKADSGQPLLTNLDTRPTLPPSVGLTVGTTEKMLKNGVFSALLAVEAVISELVSARLFPCSAGEYREIHQI
jgi:hypothetical protein